MHVFLWFLLLLLLLLLFFETEKEKKQARGDYKSTNIKLKNNKIRQVRVR
jgi:hypothetical protein